MKMGLFSGVLNTYSRSNTSNLLCIATEISFRVTPPWASTPRQRKLSNWHNALCVFQSWYRLLVSNVMGCMHRVDKWDSLLKSNNSCSVLYLHQSSLCTVTGSNGNEPRSRVSALHALHSICQVPCTVLLSAACMHQPQC